MEFLLITTAVALVVPLGLYISGRSAGRDVWGLFLRGYEKHGLGAYRAQIRPVWVAGKPPLSVHIAALTSFIMGQMVVPGALAALVGVLASTTILIEGFDNGSDWVILVLTLSSPTGLIIGGRQLGIGLRLLQRVENVVADARKLARFAITHNVVLLGALGLIFAVYRSDSVYFTAVYATISLLQALMMLRAARAIEEHGHAEERDRDAAIRPPQLADRPA